MLGFSCRHLTDTTCTEQNALPTWLVIPTGLTLGDGQLGAALCFRMWCVAQTVCRANFLSLLLSLSRPHASTHHCSLLFGSHTVVTPLQVNRVMFRVFLKSKCVICKMSVDHFANHTFARLKHSEQSTVTCLLRISHRDGSLGTCSIVHVFALRLVLKHLVRAGGLSVL